MPKQLLRVKQLDAKNLQQFVNQDVNLVTTSGSVFFGQLKNLEHKNVIFRDKVGGEHVFAFSQIQELIQDKIY